MTFFSHRPQILNFPHIFAVSVHFPPVSRKLLFPPYFDKFPPPVLHKFTCFLHTLRVFRFPLTFTMMHLCLTQCTYWTPLVNRIKFNGILLTASAPEMLLRDTLRTL